MCSTFKASLAACVLSRVDRGQDNLETLISYGATDIQDWYAPVAKANLSKGSLSVREMCRAAVEESDNTCANLLLSRVGGPPALTAFWRKNGDQVTRLEDPEPFLNRTPLGDLRTQPPRPRWGKHCDALYFVECCRSHRVLLSPNGWSAVRREPIGCAPGSPPPGSLGTRLGTTATMRRVTLPSSGRRRTSQSSSAYTHEAERRQFSKSILPSQGLAASLARSYPEEFEADHRG